MSKNEEVIAQLKRIRTELDALIKMMLETKETEIATIIFGASTEVNRAEVALLLRTLSKEQLKELGIDEVALINLRIPRM